MFDKRLACTVLALLTVTVGAIWLAGRSEAPAEPLHEAVEGVEQEASQTEAAPEYAYILREYEGRVAVFSYENDREPVVVYETLVKYLPDYDRTQMQEGIRVKSYEELISLIEDFIS